MIRRRTKRSRYRGSKVHGRGRKKRTRGSGNQGGVGMSGSGKRGDQKKTLIIKLYGNDYFGKDKALRRGKVIRVESMSLRTVIEKLDSLIKKGKAKAHGKGYEIDLKNKKIVGNENLNIPLVINALSCSEGAHAAVAKAGGKIVIKVKAEGDNR